MVKRVSTTLLLTSLLVAFMAMTVFGAKTANEQRVSNPAAIKVMDYSFPDEQNWNTTAEGAPDMSLDRSGMGRGIGWSAGTTTYDYQHNSSMHRQVDVGSSATCAWTVHLTWMYMASDVIADREQVYNGWDGAGGAAVGYYEGIVNPGEYAGYGSLDITDDNRFVIGCHKHDGSGAYKSEAFYQFQCNVPFHSATDRIVTSDNDIGSTCPGPEDYVIWPTIGVQNPPDGDRVLHILGVASCGGSGASNMNYFQYVGAEGSSGPGPWTLAVALDTIHNGEGYDLATDENGNVGITWVARAIPGGISAACDTCSINEESVEGIGFDRVVSDAYVVINRNYGRGTMGALYDGDTGTPTNWWENRRNLTKLDPDNPEGNTYPQADMISMWDSDQNFHVAWVANFYNGTFTYESRIQHWGENLGFLANTRAKVRTVAVAEWEPENCNSGSFNQNQAKLSITECGPVGSEKFYVTWVELNSPMTTGNVNHDDCAARAFAGDFAAAANGDLFMSVSDDGGLTWDAGRGLTDTYGGPTGTAGACDPAGAGGVCPSEHWMSASVFGSDYAVDGPGGNVVSVDAGYGGAHYFELSYVDDPDPGGAIFAYGAWYAADYRWIRVACVDAVEAPGFAMSRNNFSFPDYVKHCVQVNINVAIENTGNAGLTYTTNITEDPGTYTGWLAIDNFDGAVPSGDDNIETGQVQLNAGGGICDPGVGTIVRETGRVTFNTNIPSSHDFEVELTVADTVISPVWDAVSTACLSLAVANNGNMGHQGVGGVNMDYSNDPLEWYTDYDVYLYDGGTTVGWIDGLDTVMNWGLFQASIADSVALIPQGGESHSSTSWADISTSGEYTTNDTGIAFVSTWYAPLNYVDSCGFIIKKTKVYSLSGAKTGLTIGEAIDWDVPGDSTGSNNSSGSTTIGDFSVIYQQGIEMPGYDDSLELADGGWDNDQRFGGAMFMGTYIGSDIAQTLVDDAPYGMYSADNASFVYPYDLGFNSPDLYAHQSLAGVSLSDSIYDLHSGISYVFEQSLGADDTLYFYVAYATVLNDAYPLKTPSAKFTEILNGADVFARNHVIPVPTGCCDLAGDFNNSGGVDITDLTDVVDFMFGGGPGPVCFDEADVNDSGALDITDLTDRVDFMFGGGPALICGTTGS